MTFVWTILHIKVMNKNSAQKTFLGIKFDIFQWKKIVVHASKTEKKRTRTVAFNLHPSFLSELTMLLL